MGHTRMFCLNAKCSRPTKVKRDPAVAEHATSLASSSISGIARDTDPVRMRPTSTSRRRWPPSPNYGA